MATMWEVLLAFIILSVLLGAGILAWKGFKIGRKEKAGSSQSMV